MSPEADSGAVRHPSPATFFVAGCAFPEKMLHCRDAFGASSRGSSVIAAQPGNSRAASNDAVCRTSAALASIAWAKFQAFNFAYCRSFNTLRRPFSIPILVAIIERLVASEGQGRRPLVTNRSPRPFCDRVNGLPGSARPVLPDT